MPTITNSFLTDENTYQIEFYTKVFGNDFSDYVHMDRSTDGYTDGILFEHKTNINRYGKGKALSQAMIYLSRFNRDGIPVPRFTCLVSQEEQKCYIYDNNKYFSYIDNVEKYSNLKASDGISGFRSSKEYKVIDYDLNSPRGMKDIFEFIELPPEFIKINVNVHNVYGWACFYYDNAHKYRQKPEKKKLFDELKNPIGTLEQYIYPWTGKETDFTYIMDMLNDPMTQKELGAFYTPPAYCKLASELVYEAIKRVPEGNDYVIIDRCAGGGNLEMFFNDEILGHVIVSTYELKEWIVLRDRFGSRVRYIIPPIPRQRNKFPKLNSYGYLSGADALSDEIINNPVVRSYIDDNKCTIILYENPPYIETTSMEFQKRNMGKSSSSEWKNSYIVNEMRKEISGPAINDKGNVFIWSAFKYFLRQETDSYVVFSPVKYWKAQHLIEKQFIKGYAFNRSHFHAKTAACIMCALWTNVNKKENKLKIEAYDIDDDNNLVNQGYLYVKQLKSIYSDEYYDNRKFKFKKDGIVLDIDGAEPKKDLLVRVDNVYSDDIVGYMVADGSNFDSPRLHSFLGVAARYNGNGFFLHKDNFVEKLPVFAATRYTDMCNDWKVMSFVMKSGDCAKKYNKDVKNHKLDDFLCKTLIWTSMSHYPHMRSLEGSDGRLYKNELCLDGKTLISNELKKFIKNGYKLNSEEKNLIKQYNEILKMVRTPDDDGSLKENYNNKFSYGLYQIDEEINLSDPVLQRNGEYKNVVRYGDLDQAIKDLKADLKKYYIKYIVPVLFEYEFLK